MAAEGLGEHQMTKEFTLELGRVVENSGALEFITGSLACALAKSTSEDAGAAVGCCMLPDLLMMHKIQILSRVAERFVDEGERGAWRDLVSSLERLSQIRNRLLHDFVNYDNNSLIRMRSRRGKFVEERHSIDDLRAYNEEANARRRQMMDFMDDLYNESPAKSGRSQNLYPRLKPSPTWND